MKGQSSILVFFLASISTGVARINSPVQDDESDRMLFNRSLSGENRSLFEEYNRSLEYDSYFNRSLFNRSLESRRLLEEPTFYNRTLQANRSLEADESFGLYNRSLEYNYYNRSLFNRTL